MMMSSQHISNPIVNPAAVVGEENNVIRTRFGEIAVNMQNALIFPRGMLGMPDCRNFLVTTFPSEKMQQFRLLQSLDDTSLSFITLPLAPENAILQGNDIKNVCRELGINENDLVTLLIVCVHRSPGATKLSVNARAPIFVDAMRKTGMQYVFPHDAYKVQHYIG